MSIVAVLAITVVAAITLALVAQGLTSLVRGDGYGQRTGHTPPRSHAADLFEPRSRLA